MTYKSDMHDIEVHLHLEAEKAWLVSLEGIKAKAVWVPKSQAELDGRTLTAPEWLLVDKGLV